MLTGGTSQLTGVGEMASQVFAHPVRVAAPLPIDGLAEAVSGPCFSTSAGLLRYALSAPDQTIEAAIDMDRPPEGLLGKLGYWLRENF